MYSEQQRLRGFREQAVYSCAMDTGHGLRHEDNWTSRAYNHCTPINDETAWYLRSRKTRTTIAVEKHLDKYMKERATEERVMPSSMRNLVCNTAWW